MRSHLSGFVVGLAIAAGATSVLAQDSYVAGYLILPTGERVDRSYNAGFSMYVAAWPLLPYYPGHRYQTGLPGTWMFAQYDGKAPKDMYSDVEGGLGWWTDTRFATPTPKFIMGGVAPNFSEIANGPAHGAGSWEDPKGLYGVAQLSPWILFPLDGLNLKQGSCGELFGWGYLNLPLCEAKQKTAGQPLPTGGNTWTLFVNSANFKGPVAFFLPYFFSHSVLKDPALAGQLLDSRPSEPNTAIQMETQYIPCRIAKDKQGQTYARVAPVAFPNNTQEGSALMHQSTSYNPDALWKSVKEWFDGGKPSSGRIDPTGSFVRTFNGQGYATWEVRQPGEDGKEIRQAIDWNAFAQQVSLNRTTLGYKWKAPPTTTESGKQKKVVLPEYYRLTTATNRKQKWVPVRVEDVPNETNLKEIKWQTPKEDPQEPYDTPLLPATPWKWPGPAAGPFKAHLGDGTVVTYYWYRFADQPALLNADLSKEERERLQVKVEKIHRAWRKDREYLPAPTIGKLASVDPAQIVRPPKGLEIGYVPIAVRQELPTQK